MALIRPAADLLVDNPHADGLLSKHGFGYDWRFEAGKDDRPSQAASLQPGWLLDNCEIVPVLHALGLRGYAVKGDMDLTEWSIEAGDCWKLARPAGRPKAAYLFFYDARPNRYGTVMSRREYEPRVAVWLWRFSPPEGQTDPVFVEVTLHGDGLGPAYTIQVPLHNSRYKYPRLWRHDVGQAEPRLVDELGRYDAAQLALRDGATQQHLWIEETDGVLVVSLTGTAEPWVYKPEDGQGPSRGHVSVTIRGHAAMFNLQPIRYPSLGMAVPSSFLTIPYWMSQAPEYIAVTGGTGLAQVAEDPSSGGGATRPVVTLLATEAHRRPLVYMVHQYHRAEFAPGQSNPHSTAGDRNLLRLRWRRRWGRGWRFEAELRDFEGAYYWRGNEKVTVKAGWQEATSQVMVAYLEGPARRREGREYTGRAQVLVEGRDYIAARLRGKKFMAWHGSPVGWNFAEWFSYVLRRAGVPPALLDIPDDGYVIEAMPERWRNRYEFGHDVGVVTALDAVARSRGWVWGINAEGKIWAGPQPAYRGVPDFVLDEQALADGDRLLRVEAERGTSDFRNYVAVFSSREGIQAAIWHDEASHRDPTSAAFIGDDWWEVLVAPDERQPELLGWLLLQQLRRSRCELAWETLGKPDLQPGMFVEVRTSGLGVPEGAVFQIVEDVGLLDVSRSLFRSLFLAQAIDV